ncbi:cation diffusion facilitator family transporter [Sulfuricaulis sp.]|jgi:cation diffusion facilitator family transporter|uniref:cation diffusion facilitator family transporter n=1 Tax=Sulfuricaulis sp. TaxID=2003553 RepID=UPI0035598930
MSAVQEHSDIDTSIDARYGASRRVTLVSVVWNFVLTVAQIIIGFVGHSQALVADGLHTLSDLVTDFMVLFALKHGKKAADEEHPYGHARIETAVTMILGIMLVVVGAGIAISAGMRLSSAQTFVVPSAMTLWVAVITLGAKEGLYRYTMVVADRFDSNMLRANAWHHRSDALSSLIVAAGIGGSLLGFGYLDSVAALIVALMVVKVGGELAWQSLRELVDTGLATEDLESIRHVIFSISGVKALHLLRTRRVGEQALADVHIIVDGHLSVSEGHQISEMVRAKLIREIAPLADVMVHIDTEEDVNVASCADLPLRDEIQKRLNNYFRDIPEARLIEHMTLHYLNGRVDIELLLPQDAVTHSTTARQLAQQLAAAVRNDRDIGKVDVHYH